MINIDNPYFIWLQSLEVDDCKRPLNTVLFQWKDITTFYAVLKKRKMRSYIAYISLIEEKLYPRKKFCFLFVTVGNILFAKLR